MRKKKYGYILRYELPLKPNFGEDYTEKRFKELLSFCKKCQIESVMFFVAHDPNDYYTVDTVDYAREWSKQMLPYIQKLRAHGIGYEINFQNLLGSTIHGIHLGKTFELEMLMDQNGIEVACACPLGQKFRKTTEERLRVWAQTKPDVIWIDDDFRMHNHGSPALAMIQGKQSSKLDMYCYCENHIRLFNARNNTDYTRETIVKEMCREGKPSFIRTAYMDFIADTMNETTEWMVKIVHSESPDSKMAIMTSMPDVHAAEMRDWRGLLKALSEDNSPIIRAHFGPYMERIPREFIEAYSRFSQLKANLRAAYEGKIEYCPEIENTRFTVWAKSATATAYQLALGAFMGTDKITLSLFDLDGGAFFDEPLYAKVLKESKPFLSKIKALGLNRAQEQGVIIPTSPMSGQKIRLKKGEGYSSIAGEGRYIHIPLLNMGIPCRFLTPEEFDGGMVALDEFSAGFLSDKQLEDVLRGSVFIDYGAAETLINRGFSEYIGINEINSKPYKILSEEYKNRVRKDGTYIRIPSRVCGGFWGSSKIAASAEVLSHFITPFGEKENALVFFENRFGGKVLCYMAKRNWGDGFFTHHRVSCFKDAFSKLNPTLPRLDCHSYTLFAVNKLENKFYYLISNFSADKGTEYRINGKSLKENLGLYQTAIYVEEAGKIKKIGQTKLY